MENIKETAKNTQEDKSNHLPQDLLENFLDDAFGSYQRLQTKRKLKNKKTAQRRKELSGKTRRGYKKRMIHSGDGFRWDKEVQKIEERIDEKLLSLLKDGNIIKLFTTYGITLKETTSDYKGLCPRHEEKTPSFVISKAKAISKCFGCGGGHTLVNTLYLLEYGKGIHRLKRFLKLEKKIDQFLNQESISKHTELVAKKEAQKERELANRRARGEIEDEQEDFTPPF
ncbi:MAG: CHC2 zinc finger domain-containing protein [Candidatus Absconditabacteria bacterium]|nr:CHC2 zinc finger domain-containing protein [Candidatus Absconditabacteria bacterium]MDD3868184.1 CHC2 zinc finger domain-containing protein [Candidatus Absconditabacteria bacterium]MDD4714571.1 CHC2 zinc finger domain-containing protein [Candidatus Absconditabacteria bacterium]